MLIKEGQIQRKGVQTVGGNTQACRAATMKTVWKFLQKLKTELPMIQVHRFWACFQSTLSDHVMEMPKKKQKITEAKTWNEPRCPSTDER